MSDNVHYDLATGVHPDVFGAGPGSNHPIQPFPGGLSTPGIGGRGTDGIPQAKPMAEQVVRAGVPKGNSIELHDEPNTPVMGSASAQDQFDPAIYGSPTHRQSGTYTNSAGTSIPVRTAAPGTEGTEIKPGSDYLLDDASMNSIDSAAHVDHRSITEARDQIKQSQQNYVPVPRK